MNKDSLNVQEPGVLVLGYSDKLEGGVSKVTGQLIDRVPEMKLHPVLFSYDSIFKSFWQTMSSFFLYIVRLLLDREKYKVILVLVGSSGDAVRVVPFILVAKIFRKKVCIQFHKSTDIILDGLKASVARAVVLGVWKRVDLLCFLSDRLMECHKKNCGEDVSSAVIPNILDMRKFSAEPHSYNERSRDIVFLGRWSWEKGVDDLIKAMELLDIDALCEFYSDSPADVVKKNCVFYNWVDENKAAEVIRTAKLLVLPSYAEAYPTVLLESCASGTPFVATNIAGIPDIAEQSKAGLLVEPGDIDGLSSAIEKLFTDKEYWDQYSNNGRVWASAINNDDIVSLWRAKYKNLVG